MPNKMMPSVAYQRQRGKRFNEVNVSVRGYCDLLPVLRYLKATEVTGEAPPAEQKSMDTFSKLDFTRKFFGEQSRRDAA